MMRQRHEAARPTERPERRQHDEHGRALDWVLRLRRDLSGHGAASGRRGGRRKVAGTGPKESGRIGFHVATILTFCKSAVESVRWTL